ncbi:MAG: formylglycine-generating enzyme family protein [Proteobacteria bacterium]|nr:formylglycine-generating enzyme family protein [Pseudomonadota bacterium]
MAINGTASSSLLLVKGGRFEMGCGGCNLEDALPLHQVELSSFLMDQAPVTNAQFEDFVRRSKYVTLAQRKLDPRDYPSVPFVDLVPGSAVFSPPPFVVPLNHPLSWWKYRRGASWDHPEGPASSVVGREEHPVVHIAYQDAKAYCDEGGMRLPTEAEFEYAARGGLEGKKYAWGDELKPRGKWAANIWQGDFPMRNLAEDGHSGTSPVKAFPPNGYGLHDMGGNVWQWTSDWYRPDTYQVDSGAGIVRNPLGPTTSHDPFDPGAAKRVQRGGSFLCSDKYCSRYLVGSRGKGAVDSAGSNTGFRCVKDLKNAHRSH